VRLGKGFLLAFLICLGWTTLVVSAQTGGQGALEGTITDQMKAVIPHAVVVATNQASGVSTTHETTSAGVYQISPLIPGIYTVTVSAKGFKISEQKNIEVNGMTITGYNATLTVGSEDITMTVTAAPPQLQTTNSTLGDVITNKTYESLPVLMGGLQRDPTALATLAPGTQSGTRAPIMSGTGDYLAEVYLDGVPTTVSGMQGDNRPVSLSVPVESVDQMQVVSNGPSAEYQGAGAISLTTKSGGDKYHGTIVDFIRNTAFDSWGYSAPAATQVKLINGVSTTVKADKPVEHQNELSIAVGGPIPFTRHKGFFYANYDKYHGRSGVSPALTTIPTTLMRTGDFTELGSTSLIYNPLTNVCNSSSTTCSRTAYAYNGTKNVIDPTYISPISQYEQKYMPDPSLSGIKNNYLESGTSGYNNHELTFKIDYDLTKKQRYSFVYAHGVRASVGYGDALPLPYTVGETSLIQPTNMIIEHQYILTPRIVNQFKYAFTRTSGPITVPTEGVTGYRATDAGITNLPAGQASDDFPYTTFGTTTAFPTSQATWASDYASNGTPNAFTIVDNLQWSKGRHNLTFGIQTQWLEDNAVTFSTATRYFDQQFAGVSTANYVGTSLSSTATGYSYASFLLGAINNSGISRNYYTDLGGRYHPVSPYVQDDWKVNPNLTISLGLRWDYLPPYHEAADRWSFFNPNGINSVTGTAGELEFAGHRGAAISCNCRTPVHTYWKNWGPRVGLAWSANEKTVIRAGFAMSYTRAGGVGGRANDATGAGQLGFGSSMILPSTVTKGVTAAPSYYLNNSTGFAAAGSSNTDFGGSGYVIPAQTAPSVSSLTQDMGNYVSSGSYVTPSTAPGYADPYLSGRAPEFEFFNFGVQRVLTKDLTIMVNYAGSESHFVAGATVPGMWSRQIDPAHVALTGSTLAADKATNILSAQATAANIATAQAADSGIVVPSWFAAAGAISTVPTIGRVLTPYPQYSSAPTPTWDNIGNISYHSLQITLKQREWKGLSYTLNYTYSKDIGDDGTSRSAYAVPADASSSGKALPGNNRADRDLTNIDRPQNLNLYGVGKLPFGKGHIGGSNFFVRKVASGWSLAGMFNYISGTPLSIIATGCTTPSAGTCMPDLVPGMKDKVRINGSWGKGITGKNMAAVRYLNSAAFTLPNAFALPSTAKSTAVAVTKIGDAPRHGLGSTPSKYNINLSLSRSFDIARDVKFIFRADCSDITNKVTFGGIGTTWSAASSSTFGEVTSVSGNRDFQFSGKITF
jgi:hypothetical protein